MKPNEIHYAYFGRVRERKQGYVGTLAYKINPPGNRGTIKVNYGWAICSPKDEFVKSIGQKIARDRMGKRTALRSFRLHVSRATRWYDVLTFICLHMKFKQASGVFHPPKGFIGFDEDFIGIFGPPNMKGVAGQALGRLLRRAMSGGGGGSHILCLHPNQIGKTEMLHGVDKLIRPITAIEGDTHIQQHIKGTRAPGKGTPASKTPFVSRKKAKAVLKSKARVQGKKGRSKKAL